MKCDLVHELVKLSEAPRGGAGIEIRVTARATSRREAPRGGAGIEIYVADTTALTVGSPSWRGWY